MENPIRVFNISSDSSSPSNLTLIQQPKGVNPLKMLATGFILPNFCFYKVPVLQKPDIHPLSVAHREKERNLHMVICPPSDDS